MMGIVNFFKGVFAFIKFLIVVVVVAVVLVAIFKPPPFRAGPFGPFGPFNINIQIHLAPCLINITVNGTSSCSNSDHTPGGDVLATPIEAFHMPQSGSAVLSLVRAYPVLQDRKVNEDFPIV